MTRGPIATETRPRPTFGSTPTTPGAGIAAFLGRAVSKRSCWLTAD